MIYEREADELAMADHIKEQLVEHGRAAVTEANKPQRHPDFDGKHCLDCEDELPQVRLAYGRIRCTPCQIAEDTRLKRGLK